MQRKIVDTSLDRRHPICYYDYYLCKYKMSTGTNVAVHKPTNQSTTARGGSSGNANDGDPTTVHDGRRCTETLKEPSPWWSVDLLQPYPVRAVSITTRGCCGESLYNIIITHTNTHEAKSKTWTNKSYQ